MKKFVYVFILLIVNFLFCQQSFSATEKSFISEKDVLESAQFINEPEDVQKARFNAFQNVEYKIDPKTFEDYLIDKKFVAPPKKKGGKPKLKRRYVCTQILSNNTYNFFYYSNPNISYYYSSLTGKLIFYSKTIFFDDFLIEQMYNTQGNLQYIKIFETDNNYYKGYCFNKDKILAGIFEGEIFYNTSGKELFHTIGLKFF